MWWLLLLLMGCGVSGCFSCAEVHEYLGGVGQAVCRSELGPASVGLLPPTLQLVFCYTGPSTPTL